MTELAAVAPVVLRGFAIFGILLANMQGLSSSGYRSEAGRDCGRAPRIVSLNP